MSGIRGKDTKPELVIRKGLHKRGFRYRLHQGKLPGHPDIVLPRYNAVIFVQGCFWHGHNCPLFKWPGTRKKWWRSKIEGTRARDATARIALAEMGWRQARVWECALKGKHRHMPDKVIDRLSGWLGTARNELDIRGKSA